MSIVYRDALFRPLIGLGDTFVLQPQVEAEAGEDPLAVADFVYFELGRDELLVCHADQSNSWVRTLSCEELVRLVSVEEEDQFHPGRLAPIKERIASISEVWVRCETPNPYLSDIVLWNDIGKPFFHIHVDADEFRLRQVDSFPKSIDEMWLDSFFGTIAQARYR